ncbi:hypothetical protein M9Y10_018883 [Tritrichomonas musculus]|uniref:Transmembrane protein n=1 Tax=Tritrichomonas musculus TaxID=1915356 RepID=A0ABR2HIY0_9EUKA
MSKGLPRKQDGSLDMRFAVNKAYVKSGGSVNGPSLPRKKDGTLDMRFNVNKDHVNNRGSIYGPSLPRKKDGTLDMRFNVNKDYVYNGGSIYGPPFPRKKDGTLDMRFNVNKDYVYNGGSIYGPGGGGHSSFSFGERQSNNYRSSGWNIGQSQNLFSSNLGNYFPSNQFSSNETSYQDPFQSSSSFFQRNNPIPDSGYFSPGEYPLPGNRFIHPENNFNDQFQQNYFEPQNYYFQPQEQPPFAFQPNPFADMTMERGVNFDENFNGYYPTFSEPQQQQEQDDYLPTYTEASSPKKDNNNNSQVLQSKPKPNTNSNSKPFGVSIKRDDYGFSNPPVKMFKYTRIYNNDTEDKEKENKPENKQEELKEDKKNDIKNRKLSKKFQKEKIHRKQMKEKESKSITVYFALIFVFLLFYFFLLSFIPIPNENNHERKCPKYATCDMKREGNQTIVRINYCRSNFLKIEYGKFQVCAPDNEPRLSEYMETLKAASYISKKDGDCLFKFEKIGIEKIIEKFPRADINLLRTDEDFHTIYKNEEFISFYPEYNSICRIYINSTVAMPIQTFLIIIFSIFGIFATKKYFSIQN